MKTSVRILALVVAIGAWALIAHEQRWSLDALNYTDCLVPSHGVLVHELCKVQP